MGSTGRGLNNNNVNTGTSEANTTIIPVNEMYTYLKDIPNVTRQSNPEAVRVIQLAKQAPSATITIYEATSKNVINHGDYVFLDEKNAKRWTRGAMGGTKPGFKVVEKQVTASEVEWTRRGFEFKYR